MGKTYGLQELVDRAQIEDVITRYANTLDKRDYDGVASCFTEDARASYGGVELPAGRDAIIAFLRVLRQGMPDRHAGTHLASNILVTLDGDQASAESYVIAYSVPADGDPAPLKMRGVRYADRLVRTGDGWRISERIHQADWEGAVDNVPVTPIQAVAR